MRDNAMPHTDRGIFFRGLSLESDETRQRRDRFATSRREPPAINSAVNFTGTVASGRFSRSSGERRTRSSNARPRLF